MSSEVQVLSSPLYTTPSSGPVVPHTHFNSVSHPERWLSTEPCGTPLESPYGADVDLYAQLGTESPPCLANILLYWLYADHDTLISILLFKWFDKKVEPN